MRILFFISVHGHGSGGHFHSLDHISRKLREEYDVGIVTIGPKLSQIITKSPGFLSHVSFNGFNFFEFREKLRKISREFGPEIYHCFDTDCYNIVRLIFSSTRNKIVLNKCGGPNVRRFPHVNDLIVFSKENFEWFNSQLRFKKSNIHYIPNRVKALELDPNFNPIEKDKERFAFVRICRIANKYKKSIDDSLRLIDYLISEGQNRVMLILIGVVTDKDVLQELKRHPRAKAKDVILLTDYEYTAEASKMLYLADAVIGTGRGLMEASSLGLPVLTINAEGDMPVLLDESSFYDAFRTNFSERNHFPDSIKNENQAKISRLVEDEHFYLEKCRLAKSLFDQYFDINKVPALYHNVYVKATTNKRYLIRDTMQILASIYGFISD